MGFHNTEGYLKSETDLFIYWSMTHLHFSQMCRGLTKI